MLGELGVLLITASMVDNNKLFRNYNLNGKDTSALGRNYG